MLDHQDSSRKYQDTCLSAQKLYLDMKNWLHCSKHFLRLGSFDQKQKYHVDET